MQLVDTAEGDISLYTQGGFTDLCRGPHLQNSKPIKALKLTGLAGAYWRGDSTQPQLTRIYGTAFYSQKDLDAYLERLAEARKRDHRVLGQRLDLFHFDEHSPGSPFWHPKGMVIYNVLEAVRRRENARRGYVEVKTPLIYDKALWVTSGHWDKFRENMFLIPLEDGQVYGIKPMNCPGHMLLFGETLRSYRELPLRYAEAAPLHRNELAGALHGLTRVRYVTQDDAHIFCTQEQISGELDAAIDYMRYLYGLFGLEPRAEFSTRPDDKLGSDAEWDFSEGELNAALERNDIEFSIGAGEGSFYGPKIDLHVRDVLGRSWQLGTIQLDRQMPQRFGLTYMGPDNTEHPVFVIHRALFGSFERFIGILIEHYAGAFPFWLSPVQVRVLPVGEAPSRGCARDRRAPARGRVPGRRGRADRDDRQADPLRGAREDPVHDRLRRPGERAEPRHPRARGRANRGIARGIRSRSLLRLTPEKQGRTRSSPPGRKLCGVQPSRSSDEETGRCMQRLFCVCQRETRRSKPNLVICL